MAETYDVIVIGLGAMGSATLYQLAKRGQRVLGIDRFTPPHRFGSSHGDTRITRVAIGEGAEYVPLVMRTHEIWRELEAATGKQLLTTCGGLILSSSPHARHHGVDFFENTVAAAVRFGIPHEFLDPPEVERRFPHFRLQGYERAYFEPGAGFVRPEACIEAQLALASRLGAVVHTDELVSGFERRNGTLQVTTAGGVYVARQLVVTAGAWIAQLLGERYASLFRVYRQVLHWFEADAAIVPDSAPVFIWQLGEAPDDLVYGFPPVDGPAAGMKIAADSFDHPVDPADGPVPPEAAEAAQMYQRYIAEHFNGVGPRVLRSEPCFYTVTPGYRFVIDRHPALDEVIIASPCSGHGFKHSAAIGEALAQLAISGASAIDISPFRLPEPPAAADS